MEQAAAAVESQRRVLVDLEELARMSAGGAGVNRLAYSPQDMQAREWFRRRCASMGLRFQEDPVGNSSGWSKGAVLHPPVMLGSHLDSVIDAGRYDGTVGVVLGFEVVRRLLEQRPELPLAVVSWACEESTRFGMGAVGSRFLFGELRPDDLDKLRDRDGQTLRELLREAGVDDGTPLRVGEDFIDSYVEVHIDQGHWLAEAGARLALVTKITGVKRLRLGWTGEASHSGAQPHSHRRDALLAAADFALQADALWSEIDPQRTDSLAITAGQLRVFPNSPNTVPGKVDMIVDLRSADLSVLTEANARVSALAHEVARSRRVEVAIEDLGGSTPLAMDPALRTLLKKAADQLGIPLMEVVSLAGHDALKVGSRFPASMLLVANPTGLSHSPLESVDERGLSQAIELLVSAIPAFLAL